MVETVLYHITIVIPTVLFYVFDCIISYNYSDSHRSHDVDEMYTSTGKLVKRIVHRTVNTRWI